jgi:dienelactone hydrolase
MRVATALALTLFGALAAFAAAPAAEEPKIEAKPVEHEHGGEKLTGFLYRDPSREGPRPGVLVIHEFWGLGAHAKKKAEEIARLGYVALAVDMYGTGKVTDHPKQASEWAGRFRGREGKPLGRERAASWLEVLKKTPGVDPKRTACIGYCFGGTMSLELAWSGADFKAAVSFHGNPLAPTEAEAKAVKAAVLVCHGADDDHVKAETLAALEQALRTGGVDWTLVKYGGAVHSFTNPEADARGMKGVKYDAKADRRSFEHMRTLFREAFGE